MEHQRVEDSKASWDAELGAELERMAVSEQLKNSGVTPGQMPKFLASAAPKLVDTPEVLSGQPMPDVKEGQTEYGARGAALAGPMGEFKNQIDGKGSPGLLKKEGNLLDSCVLADIKDQGASPDQMNEVLHGGQFMVPGRELAEDWASMPQSDARRSSHHTPEGKSKYESGRGMSGTPEYQMDSRRHTGTSAPFMHHLLSGTVNEKGSQTVDEKTFFQLENTPWTEKPNPETGVESKEKPSKSEQAGHAWDAVQYFATGKSQNVGPYGYSKQTDPKAVDLPGQKKPTSAVVNDNYAD